MKIIAKSVGDIGGVLRKYSQTVAIAVMRGMLDPPETV